MLNYCQYWTELLYSINISSCPPHAHLNMLILQCRMIVWAHPINVRSKSILFRNYVLAFIWHISITAIFTIYQKPFAVYYATAHMHIMLLIYSCLPMWQFLSCHKVVAFYARFSQPCRVVTTLHDSCEIVVQIVNSIPQVNVIDTCKLYKNIT